MAKKQLTPTESYEAACARMTFAELVAWVWKTRVKNGLMVARRRRQEKATITLVDRHGGKLLARDRQLREKIQEMLKEGGYLFTESFGGTEKTIQVRVVVKPLRPIKAEVEIAS